MKLSYWLSIVALMASSSVFADQGHKPLQLRPLLGFRFGGEFENLVTGDSVRVKSAPAYGLALDFSPSGGPEKLQLLWSHQEAELDASGWDSLSDFDLTIDYFGIGGLIEYPQGPYVPYASMTLGATHIDAQGYGSDTRFSFSIGGGLKYFPGEQKRLALHADVRGYGTVVDSNAAFIYSGGQTVIAYSADVWWQLEASIGVLLAF
ncbi:hypothetical protein [Coraliomargarita akajimensis]|uniref:Outer membrane protein beta-barrel domain-containing protein n=1 Tax=Coraliomargarita akajimensis (strain DSM 45221 / IAM 15411 / JCM 23193 / KCTC 12865 / 04OKA010-24) TaxID=583355 RepID=D5EPF2_CORAD|nr:hypothetical protein [Coraliomargarita akajimensis]ADE53689.1 conserved hypothetical protein [Coraliomargarita akajimensis DSM 45221]